MGGTPSLSDGGLGPDGRLSWSADRRVLLLRRAMNVLDRVDEQVKIELHQENYRRIRARRAATTRLAHGTGTNGTGTALYSYRFDKVDFPTMARYFQVQGCLVEFRTRRDFNLHTAPLPDASSARGQLRRAVSASDLQQSELDENLAISFVRRSASQAPSSSSSQGAGESLRVERSAPQAVTAPPIRPLRRTAALKPVGESPALKRLSRQLRLEEECRELERQQAELAQRTAHV